MDAVTHIFVARDFSDAPGGRYLSDGEGNATQFRDRFLVPALREERKVIVHLDEAAGYPSSFLEESFGGLVRMGYSAEIIKKFITVVAESPRFARFINLIDEYIDRATKVAKLA